MLLHLSDPALLAYLDPGSGSFLFQMLIAGVLSMGVMLATMRQRVALFFKGLFRRRGQ